jgi:hypothetical protein
MIRILFLVTFALISSTRTGAAENAWNDLPVKALLLAAPDRADVPLFCKFVREALPKEGVNTLVLRINYSYHFESRPELAESGALSKEELKQIVQACKDAGVKLVPKMNLFAHQSDRTHIGPLLAKHPEFDESPDFNPPNPWKDGGMHDFYTKSLCPLHPDLHKVIFPAMDELIDLCGADAFHCGLDEVWIIAYPKCPRCGGRDPAEIFAEHVRALHDHLASKGCRMWMWSDRLIDGKTSGLLAWQASMNNTWRSIDMIPNDIVICDWKYEDAPPTPGYFAIKGFDVLASPCSKTDVALDQLAQIYAIRKNGEREDFSKTIASRAIGVFETSWMSAGNFIRAYYATNAVEAGTTKNNVVTFKALFAEIRKNQPSK